MITSTWTVPDAPIYSAPGEKGPGGQQFPPGFVYISYIDRVDLGQIYYLLQNGGWIPGKGSRVGEISGFQGLEFRRTPQNSFGWAFDKSQSITRLAITQPKPACKSFHFKLCRFLPPKMWIMPTGT